MALSLTLDTVNEAELEQTVINSSRLVRTGILKGITTSTVTSAKLAMLKAMSDTPGMPALGDTYDASYTNYVLLHRVIRGIPNTGGHMARVWLHYETASGSTPLERFAAEDSIVTQAEPTEVFPGTAQQILVSTDGSSPEYDGTDNDAVTHVITLNWPRSLRALVLYGLFADPPSVNVKNAVNTVNSATWQGLARGRWKCDSVRVRYSSRDGMYAVTCGFLNKGEELGADWSTYEVPLLPTTGKRALVDSAVLAAEYAKPYTYGIMSDKNSLGHWGIYPTRNFTAIFGNDFIP